MYDKDDAYHNSVDFYATAGNGLHSPSPLHLLPSPPNDLSPSRYVSVAAQVVYIGVHTETHKPIPMVARVSMTDYRGNILLDTYVRPTHIVTEYRSSATGLQCEHLAAAPAFEDVQRRVYGLIKNKVLVGHSLWLFLSVLGLKHPTIHTRDLALFLPLRRRLKTSKAVNLSLLVHHFMGRNVGLDYEDPLEMARAAIDLFRSCEEVFEDVIRTGAWPCDLPPVSYAEYFT
ncbi:Ribonuclease H superfamily protein [Pleurotus pulmonarius]